jgi:hypothetical protein
VWTIARSSLAPTRRRQRQDKGREGGCAGPCPIPHESCLFLPRYVTPAPARPKLRAAQKAIESPSTQTDESDRCPLVRCAP